MIKWQPALKGYPVPWWVKMCSYCFLLFLVYPLLDLAIIFESPDAHWSLWAFGFQVDSNHFTLPQIALAQFLTFLLFLGGLSALGILLKKRWGLLVGRVYSLAVIAACVISGAAPSQVKGAGADSGVTLIALVAFFWWIDKTLESVPASQNHGQHASQLR